MLSDFSLSDFSKVRRALGGKVGSSSRGSCRNDEPRILLSSVERLNASQVDGIVVTNTCRDASNPLLQNLTTVSIAPLLGEAIRRVHRNESVSHLFD